MQKYKTVNQLIVIYWIFLLRFLSHLTKSLTLGREGLRGEPLHYW